MENKLDYKKLYEEQDKFLEIISGLDNGFYLTGGTCLHRFHINKRYSDDLDFFCNDNDLFREYSRELFDKLKMENVIYEINIDTRDFMRIKYNGHLKIDFVNDRVFRLGRSILTEKGYKIDNVFNILTNKITAVIGRDEPKDIFDIYSISKFYEFSWSEMIEVSLKKCFFELDLFIDRLQSFPVSLFERINAVDEKFLDEAKNGIFSLADNILKGFNNGK
jgi:predicted nucleotidyltransferase component of viral defense system